MENKELWEKWEPEVHESSDAKKRIASAQKADLTPLKIEAREDKTYGYFQGKHGSYETTLDFCPCGDFRRRELPCKHIYRLAIELQLMEGNIISDKSKIKIPRNKNGLELIPALDIIDDCSEKAQFALWRFLSNIRKGTYQVVVTKNSTIQELIDKNIFVECNNDELKYKSLQKRTLAKLLKENGFDIDDKQMSRDELINLALLNLPQHLQNICSNKIVITINERFANVKMKLYTYLNRKLFPCEIINEDGVEVTVYPNDEITALLKLRGFLEEDANIIGENVTIVSDYE